jgi:hypothetical protein
VTNRIAPALGLAVLLAASAATAQRDDLLIVPGERVGPVSRQTSEDTLRALYGADRVTPHLVELGEGLACRGSKVTWESGDSLEIVWRDADAGTGVVSIHVKGQRWRTREGVGFGITLRELERLNGKPFELTGFGWDYAGTVISWSGGSLEASMSQTSAARLIVRLAPHPDDEQRLTPEENGELAGDRNLSSARPALQKLNPRVYALIVLFDENMPCELVDVG